MLPDRPGVSAQVRSEFWHTSASQTELGAAHGRSGNRKATCKPASGDSATVWGVIGVRG